MESEFSPDKEIPPVPIKTYQWEDVRRAREAGGYPWTYLLKPPLEGEITAEDILRESTPSRSMSREFSRSRTHLPAGDDQKILNLDSSPGSSRKYGEEGQDEGVHVPNFSKEVSLDSEDDAAKSSNNVNMTDAQLLSQSSSHLTMPIQIPKNISPKSILKRRGPEPQFIGFTETREKTKCCHPLVNKIKHLADKTLQKLERSDIEKSPQSKRKKNEEPQEIRELKTSPGAVRRQMFSAIKLGDSDEMSKSMAVDQTPPSTRKRKEHIYEDIEESKQGEKSLHFSPEIDNMERESGSFRENDSILEKKSNASQDPSLVAEEMNELKPEEHIMEKLHKLDDINKEAVILDDDTEEPNVDEIFQNQLEEAIQIDGSPNITITEITDDIVETETGITTEPRIDSSPSPQEDIADKHSNLSDITGDWSKTSRRWTSEGGDPLQKSLRPSREGSVQSYTLDVRCGCQYFQSDSLLPERINPVGTRPTSRASNFISNASDHEYEIIEKPSSNTVYKTQITTEKPTMVKTDDELSSTTSLERKFLQHHSDEEEQHEYKENSEDYRDENILNAEALQKDIEDQYFSNTPSLISRTECEISTSQVDSSALENLPLKRGSRKNAEGIDSKIQQRIKEGTGKLKSQAGKLKTKLQNIKASMPDKPKISFPDRSKFKMPERPRINFPERPKFSLPDRRKFSLPDRPKFKKINISEKLTLGDRKKFTLPERPKFSVPEMPKFKLPDRPKINFSSLGRKKENKVETMSADSNKDLRNAQSEEFESKTFPRLFNRKKKSSEPTTSSSPAIDREDTPPPVFTFTRMKKTSIPRPDSPEAPREYGNIDDNEFDQRRNIDDTYDFDKVQEEYIDKNEKSCAFKDNWNASSEPKNSPCKQEYSHVINEINNDEFFVRPRGISRENIQVREYLSDEIRQAFNIPKNALSLMGNTSRDNEERMYANDVEADPELELDDNENSRYSNEDLNDNDDGYYTFPPVRPSRAKRKKKELDSVQYIDESVHASMQFSEVDLGLSEYHADELQSDMDMLNQEKHFGDKLIDSNVNELQDHYQHRYANGETCDYPNDIPIQSQTLPMPPKRKKKSKSDNLHSSYNDFREIPSETIWKEPGEQTEDIIVYRTEHEYIVPRTETVRTEHSPLPPRRSRNRSRSSHGTSLCDDDRTSHGAESLTLDTHIPHDDDVEIERQIRHESPGYATVDKGPYAPIKSLRRSKSKTPPVRRRKSSGTDPKYHTVGPNRVIMPDRPPRKKSSTSLMALDSIKRSLSGDITQYDEIDEPPFEEVNKDLVSGEIISKMKDRPLPPPPRPPRDSRKKKSQDDEDWKGSTEVVNQQEVGSTEVPQAETRQEEVIEIEVSTQTDPLPDDVDYELGMEDNLDVSMTSSLKDIGSDEHIPAFLGKLGESPRLSRPTSRSEKSFKISDPKISELSKSTLGRTSPTVILVERRVSSPTRINEREEMLTEASLTVQHIDVDESKIPDVPPLPMPRGSSTKQTSKTVIPSDKTIEKISDINRDVHLDNLVTQRLQVRDLDVGRLNVSELQASKILVSDIEGMTLQVTELDSKSGHISVSGIEFSQNIIDEIVKKFAELTSPSTSNTHHPEVYADQIRPVSREEQTQTDRSPVEEGEAKASFDEDQSLPPRTVSADDAALPPQRPPPPDLTPLLYSYLQDMAVPSTSLYHVRPPRERPFTEFHETQHQSPPPPSRRVKRKTNQTAPHSESSSDDSIPRPSPRKMHPSVKAHEPSVSEAGAQFLRVCHNSISRTLRNMFNTFMSYISGTEDKKDVQMALVIFLVLIAGLIMFGLSDSRTIHHHHWEFFNPPEGKP